jgi:hypothetical protein
MSAGKAPDGLRQSFLSGLSSVFGDMNEGRSINNMQMSGGGINQTNKKYTIKTRKNKNKNKNKKSKKRWSLKYKRSIDCKRPRGFSQRQYCNYGRKKS